MKIQIIFVSALFALASLANAEILTFDDIGSTSESVFIPDGYGGFEWIDFYYNNMSTPSQTNGYNNGLVSGEYAAHNSGYLNTVEIQGNPFIFTGAFFTAAWRDGLEIQIDGYANDVLLYSNVITVNTYGPIWAELDYNNIDRLVFSSYGGTPHDGYSHDGYHFVMDNFTYIPEPNSIILMIGTLILTIRKRH